MSIILDLHQRLLAKDFSVKELTQMHLSAIAAENSKLNAYINITENEAMLAAEIADRKFMAHEDTDILAGIPMTLKDNISTKDIETSCCSRILEGYTPPYDATAWRKLRKKDAVLLGKTNMDEFAMGCSTETSAFGTSRNPYNQDYVAGGSSGGSAAAVAGNLAIYALGSDTGGSVRQPASVCGCVGLKPTYGAVSRYGLIAYASSLDTIGILAQSAMDVSVVFNRISGYDSMDSTSLKDVKRCLYENTLRDVKGRKIGIPQELIDRADAEVKDAVLKGAKLFEDLGCNVEFFSMPALITALPAYYVIACAEASSNLGRYDGIRYGTKAEEYESIHEMICKTRGEKFGDEVKKRIMLGTFVLSEGYYDKYYAKAQRLRNELKVKFSEVFGNYDVLLTPTSPKTAFRLGEVNEDREGSFNSDLCTVSANLAGLPAISVPCGKDSMGLPVGIQLIGNRFDESLLVNMTHKFEEARGIMKIENMGVRL